jgi:hypothetical protein
MRRGIKKYIFCFTLLLNLLNAVYLKGQTGSCITAGAAECTISGSPLGTYTPNTNWSNTSNFSITSPRCINFYVTSGYEYEFSLCPNDGAQTCSGNAKLALYKYNGSNSFSYLCYNDNASNCSQQTNAPKIKWLATFSGTVSVLVYQTGCSISCSFIMAYRACGLGTPTITSFATPSTTICRGDSLILTANPGDSNTKWYTGSCGGTYIGSGATITYKPSSTQTIYANNQGCNSTTSCKSVTITVNSLPATPSSSVITQTGTTCAPILSKSTSPTGITWYWQGNNCDKSTSLGSSTTISVSNSGYFYLRARQNSSGCWSIGCAEKYVQYPTTSNDPTSITSTTDTICMGDSTTLTVNGGQLGTGAAWKWYSASCGSGYVGTGNSIKVSPTNNTTYYVRAEGTCGNTWCVSRNIYVATNPNDPPVLNSNSPQCTSVQITPSTASPSGVYYYWQGNSCGKATNLGTSFNSYVAYSSGTYYLRAKNNNNKCWSKNCSSINVVINNSSQASSIISSKTNICKGETVRLTATGGNLGLNSKWKWYEGSCGGNYIGEGSFIDVTPNITQISGTVYYYVRAEGDCGNTNCAAIGINVRNTSDYYALPQLALTNCNQISISNVTSGLNYYWQGNTCDTLKNNNNTYLTINDTGTYYVKTFDGYCWASNCASIKVSEIQQPSIAPDSIIGNGKTYCKNSAVKLKRAGGTLGTNAEWRWYKNGCSGSSLGTGDSIIIYPTEYANYYASSYGGCNQACNYARVYVDSCGYNNATITPDIIATDGGYHKISQGSFSYTIGEPITETFTGNNKYLTQGFQQAHFKITLLKEIEIDNRDVLLFPNPTEGKLNLSFNNFNSDVLVLILITDVTGRKLQEITLKPVDAKYLDLTNYTIGTYLITINSNKNQFSKTYKIEKVY